MFCMQIAFFVGKEEVAFDTVTMEKNAIPDIHFIYNQEAG